MDEFGIDFAYTITARSVYGDRFPEILQKFKDSEWEIVDFRPPCPSDYFLAASVGLKSLDVTPKLCFTASALPAPRLIVGKRETTKLRRLTIVVDVPVEESLEGKYIRLGPTVQMWEPGVIASDPVKEFREEIIEKKL